MLRQLNLAFNGLSYWLHQMHNYLHSKLTWLCRTLKFLTVLDQISALLQFLILFKEMHLSDSKFLFKFVRNCPEEFIQLFLV